LNSDASSPHERLRERDDVGLGGHADGAVDGGVQEGRFADDGVEVLEGDEIVHRGRVMWGCPEFFAQLGLDFRMAGESDERPCGRGRGRLVTLIRRWVRGRGGGQYEQGRPRKPQYV